MEDVKYTSVQCVCSGIVTNIDEELDTYEVFIYQSPMGEFQGPVYAKEINPPGMEKNVKKGDHVKVEMSFAHGGVEEGYVGQVPGSANYILGVFNEQAIIMSTPENPISENDNDRVRHVHRRSGAGIVATEEGKIIIATGSSIYSSGKPGGFGITQNLWRTEAQNHIRRISFYKPFYSVKEHFGLFLQSDEDDIPLRTDGDAFPVIFRRFVTQSLSPDNWVSTCEGTWSPYVGPNNDSNLVSKGSEVLFSKVINHSNTPPNGDMRLTVEAGEPGGRFVNVRIDQVIRSESFSDVIGAVPASVGNKLKLQVHNDGSFDLRAAGKGIPNSNLNKFHMSVDGDGKLTVHAAGGIVFSHGDSESGNSISIDPDKGIDITAKKGLRVNGVALLTSKFSDWMKTWKKVLCQSGAPGSPAPMNPVLVEPAFDAGLKKPGDFLTDNNTPIPPTAKIIKDTDSFTSV